MTVQGTNRPAMQWNVQQSLLYQYDSCLGEMKCNAQTTNVKLKTIFWREKCKSMHGSAKLLVARLSSSMAAPYLLPGILGQRGGPPLIITNIQHHDHHYHHHHHHYLHHNSHLPNYHQLLPGVFVIIIIIIIIIIITIINDASSPSESSTSISSSSIKLWQFSIVEIAPTNTIARIFPPPYH